MPKIICNSRGFTWVELIVVMVIIGIVSVVLGTGLMRSDTELAAQTEVIKTHLRYAQSRSMNSNSAWYIQFGSNAYALYQSGDANPKLLPGGSSPTITLPDGISINYGSSNIVSFDGWGKPHTDVNAQNAQTTDRTITVAAGSASRTITITKNTGFIQ